MSAEAAELGEAAVTRRALVEALSIFSHALHRPLPVGLGIFVDARFCSSTFVGGAAIRVVSVGRRQRRRLHVLRPAEELNSRGLTHVLYRRHGAIAIAIADREQRHHRLRIRPPIDF